MVMLFATLITALLAAGVHGQRIELWSGTTTSSGRVACAGTESTTVFANSETCFPLSFTCWFSVADGTASILAYKSSDCSGASRRIFATLAGNTATSDFIAYNSFRWTTPGVNDKRDEGEGNNTLAVRLATTLNDHSYIGSQLWVVESFTVNLVGTQIILAAGVTALKTAIQTSFPNGFRPNGRSVVRAAFAGNTYQLIVDNVKTSVDAPSVMAIFNDAAEIAAQTGDNSFGLAIDNTAKAVQATLAFTIQ